MPTRPWNDDADDSEEFDDGSEFDDDPQGPQPCDLAEDDDEDGYGVEPCPHCGRDVSELADRCRHCGEWIVQGPAKSFRRGPIFVAIAILLLLLFLLMIF